MDLENPASAGAAFGKATELPTNRFTAKSMARAELPRRLRLVLNWRTCVGAVVGLLLLYVALGSQKSLAGRPIIFKHRVMFFQHVGAMRAQWQLGPAKMEIQEENSTSCLYICTKL